MTTTTELKKLLFSMILKTPIWLVHLAANQSSVMSIPTYATLKFRGTNRMTSIHYYSGSGICIITIYETNCMRMTW